MCGITGIIGPVGRLEGVEQILRDMTSVMVHRGPDDEGYHIGADAALGFRRLSIIDLSTGHQPIYNEDRTCAVIFNGEVYNYRTLKDELRERGHRFYTNTDTETIVHAYEEYGEACVDRFIGMFAFCIWDDARKKAFFARDRLGIKPLYYIQNGRFLLFASEIKSLMRSGIPRGEINYEAISNYLTYRFCPAPQSPFRDIRKLPPAHTLTYQGGEVRVKRYWRVREFGKINGSEKVIGRQLVEKLKTAVERRLISDVPLGLFLSGGVDSSVILALMSELMKEPVKTFTIGFDFGKGYQEFEYADQVARMFGTEHRSMTIGSEEFIREIPHIVWHLDEPVADSATIPLYFISRLAKNHVTVALSGEGSDELFAGYSRLYMDEFRKHRMKKWLRMLPEFTRGSLISRIVDRYIPRYSSKLDFVKNPPDSDRIRLMSQYFDADEKKELFSEGVYRNVAGVDSYDILKFLLEEYKGIDFLDRKLIADLSYWLPDNLLIKADRASMANGIELRVPFLDHEFVEYAFRLKDKFKISGSQGKYLLKKAFEPLLPRDILYRPKMGFPVPIAEWFRGELKEAVSDLLLGERSTARGIFRRDKVKELLETHTRGDKNLSGHIWILLIFEIWCRIFIDGDEYAKIVI